MRGLGLLGTAGTPSPQPSPRRGVGVRVRRRILSYCSNPAVVHSLHVACSRRRRLPGLAAIAVAAGASARRFARDIRRGDARARARFDACPIWCCPAGRKSRRPASRNSCRRRRIISRSRRSNGSPCRAASFTSNTARRSTAIERQFGVPPAILLAIFGRETDYGRAADNHNAIRVLATQAYLGKRKEQFLNEFLLALKILQQRRYQACRHEKLLGRRHGADAISAVGLSEICRRFRRRRQSRYLEFGAGRAGLRRQAIARQRLAARPALGL